jgi:predicted DNA-binding transcriptional regulator AlpA
MTRALSKPRDVIVPQHRQDRAKLTVGAATRPPSYISRKQLAWELDSSESSVDELVRRGVIPPPIKLTAGCIRWSWQAVQERLAIVSDTVDDGDPYMTGAANATA